MPRKGRIACLSEIDSKGRYLDNSLKAGKILAKSSITWWSSDRMRSLRAAEEPTRRPPPQIPQKGKSSRQTAQKLTVYQETQDAGNLIGDTGPRGFSAEFEIELPTPRSLMTGMRSADTDLYLLAG